jgi:hypothetical protein
VARIWNAAQAYKPKNATKMKIASKPKVQLVQLCVGAALR